MMYENDDIPRRMTRSLQKEMIAILVHILRATEKVQPVQMKDIDMAFNKSMERIKKRMENVTDTEQLQTMECVTNILMSLDNKLGNGKIKNLILEAGGIYQG